MKTILSEWGLLLKYLFHYFYSIYYLTGQGAKEESRLHLHRNFGEVLCGTVLHRYGYSQDAFHKMPWNRSFHVSKNEQFQTTASIHSSGTKTFLKKFSTRHLFFQALPNILFTIKSFQLSSVTVSQISSCLIS